MSFSSSFYLNVLGAASSFSNFTYLGDLMFYSLALFAKAKAILNVWYLIILDADY